MATRNDIYSIVFATGVDDSTRNTDFIKFWPLVQGKVQNTADNPEMYFSVNYLRHAYGNQLMRN